MTGSSEAFRDLILYDASYTVNRIFSVTKGAFFSILPAILIGSAFFTFLFDWDFKGIIKRLIITMVIIGVYTPFYESVAELGFIIGSKILVSKSNILTNRMNDVDTFQNAGFSAVSPDKKLKGKDSNILSIWDITKLKTTGGYVLFLLSNLALWFVKFSFTLAYWIPLCLVPIVCLISLMPMTSKAIDTAYIGLIWVGVTPIVIAVIVELMADIVNTDQLMNPISQTAFAILAALYLMGSFKVSSSIIKGGNISDVASQVGAQYGTAAALLGVSLMKNIATGGSNFALKKGLGSFMTKKNNINALKGSIMDNKQFRAGDYLEGKTKPENMNNYEEAAWNNNKWWNSRANKRENADISNTAQIMKDEGRSHQNVTRKEINRYRVLNGKKPIDEVTGKKIKHFDKKDYLRPDDKQMKEIIKGEVVPEARSKVSINIPSPSKGLNGRKVFEVQRNNSYPDIQKTTRRIPRVNRMNKHGSSNINSKINGNNSHKKNLSENANKSERLDKINQKTSEWARRNPRNH